MSDSIEKMAEEYLDVYSNEEKPKDIARDAFTAGYNAAEVVNRALAQHNLKLSEENQKLREALGWALSKNHNFNRVQEIRREFNLMEPEEAYHHNMKDFIKTNTAMNKE